MGLEFTIWPPGAMEELMAVSGDLAAAGLDVVAVRVALRVTAVRLMPTADPATIDTLLAEALGEASPPEQDRDSGVTQGTVAWVSGEARWRWDEDLAEVSIPQSVLERLLPPIVAGVAVGPGVFLDGRWSNSASAKVRAAVAVSPFAPAETLQMLATDSTEAVLEGVSANPRTPADTLRSLYGRCSGTGLVSYCIGSNPSTPEPTLRAMADDAAQVVFVSSNPRLPADLFHVLAARPEPWIRSRIASNPGCPLHLLLLLAKDRDANVREAAQPRAAITRDVMIGLVGAATSEIQERGYRGSATTVGRRAAVAREDALSPNANAIAEVVRRVGTGQGAVERSRFEVDEATDPRVLDVRAGDRRPEVRRRVAWHPATSLATLARLTSDADEWTRLMARARVGADFDVHFTGGAPITTRPDPTERSAVHPSSYRAADTPRPRDPGPTAPIPPEVWLAYQQVQAGGTEADLVELVRSLERALPRWHVEIIKAIREIRSSKFCGLKEAKDLVVALSEGGVFW